MASAVDTQSFEARYKCEPLDHDPGGTTAIVVSADGGTTKHPVDMKDCSEFIAQVKPTVVGGNGITLFEIIASAATAMSTPTIVKTTGAIQLDALSDYATLSCTDDEVRFLGATLRYVTARITMATGTDEACVIQIEKLKRKVLDSTTAVQQA